MVMTGRDHFNKAKIGATRDTHGEVMVHEGAHAVLDPILGGTPAWNDAARADAGFISDYAKSKPDGEDIAESLVIWLATKFGILNEEDTTITTNQIPNRLALFDQMDFNLFPLGDGTKEINGDYQWEPLGDLSYPCGFWEGGETTVIYSPVMYNR